MNRDNHDYNNITTFPAMLPYELQLYYTSYWEMALDVYL